MPLIIIPNIPEMLQNAQIDSPEFGIAIDAFLTKLKEALGGHPSMFKVVMAEHFSVLSERFRGGQDLNHLVRRIGACRVIALFFESILVDQKSLAEGPMVTVNRFAAEHFPTCEHCSLHYEAARRLRRLVSAATEPSENRRRLRDTQH